MLQTNLNYRNLSIPREGACSGRLLLTWGLYGFAMLLLWRAIPHESFWIAAALWGVAGIAALGVLLTLGEI
jgi:hypothetical protein